MSTRPVHGCLDGGLGRDVGPRRAAHDDHRQPALPRRVELGSRVRSAAVLGDDQVDCVVIDERQLPIERVRATIEQDLAAGRKRRAGRVDAADQEPGVVDARESRRVPGGRWSAGRARPCPRWPRRPRRDRRPSASGRRGARSNRGARGAGSARRRPARPAPPMRRCAARTGGWRRPRRRRGALRASARAPRGRRSRRCGRRPPAAAGWRRARRATRSPPRPLGAGARRARAPRPCLRGSGPRDRP